MAIDAPSTTAGAIPALTGNVNADPRPSEREATAPPRESTSWGGHVPALDGVRGLAIALVMICHIMARSTPAGFVDRGVVEVARGGWVGVDLFFVLSGFLITGILLDARGTRSYFRNFYVRRTLRIFPLYYGILVTVFVAAPLIAAGVRDHEWFKGIEPYQPWFWTYSTNVLVAMQGTWYPTGVLGHFWSLAVEEQFYLVWPAVVFLLSPRQLRHACAAILIAALGLRFSLALTRVPDLGAFTLMPARADTLAAGAWLAVALRTGVQPETLQRLGRWVLPSCAAAVGALFVWYRRLSEADIGVETIGFTCLALGFAALLTLTLDSPQHPTAFGRVFRTRALRVLGKYSYAMYCFHPLIQSALRAVGVEEASVPVIGGSVLPGVILYGIVVLALTFAVSYLSWHVFEKHFLRLKDRFATRARRPGPVHAQRPVLRSGQGAAPVEG